VPQEWLKIINKFGGAMGETYGVPVEEIVEGIRHGVCKGNIGTACVWLRGFWRCGVAIRDIGMPELRGNLLLNAVVR